LHASPPRPRSVRPDLPEKLDEILLKSLEKDRELRYQSAAELRGDLKRLLRESGEAAKLASPSPAPASTSSPPPPASSDGALAIGLLRRHPRTVGVVALVVAAAAAALWWALARSGPATARNSEVSLQPLTFHGLAGDTTISADGKFIAYTRQNGTESSVVVRQLSSDSDVVILPPRAGVSYYAPSVTPDGGYVDVLEVDASITFKTRVLRVPLLGGAPRQLLGDGVRSGIGWSADGQRMVFNRSDAPAENSIVIADAQGQNLRVLATRRAPSFFINVTFGRRAARPAWSPDGRRIAALGLKNSPDGIDQHLVEIDVETGSERVMHRFVAASEVAYLDQDRWLASAVQPETMTVPWEVIPRQGSPVAITRDLSLLRGVQLTTDRSTGVALRTTLRSAIAVGAIAGADFAQAIEESGTEPGNAALDGAGNVFYSMRTSDGFAVFRRAREGGASTLIVRNLARPVPSNDGTFLFGPAAQRRDDPRQRRRFRCACGAGGCQRGPSRAEPRQPNAGPPVEPGWTSAAVAAFVGDRRCRTIVRALNQWRAVVAVARRAAGDLHDNGRRGARPHVVRIPVLRPMSAREHDPRTFFAGREARLRH
jgi:hypothetical protein